MHERQLKACVSGSFLKFKPEIDLAIEELSDLGVTVLAPDKGWIYIPPQRIFNPSELKFRSLPSEKGMPIKDVEDNFLLSVAQSDFLYVVNPGGYIGNVVAMEMGFATALGVPVFLQHEVSRLADFDEIWGEIEPNLKVCTIQEAIAQVKSQLLLDSG